MYKTKCKVLPQFFTSLQYIGDLPYEQKPDLLHDNDKYLLTDCVDNAENNPTSLHSVPTSGLSQNIFHH